MQPLNMIHEQLWCLEPIGSLQMKEVFVQIREGLHASFFPKLFNNLRMLSENILCNFSYQPIDEFMLIKNKGLIYTIPPCIACVSSVYHNVKVKC